MNEWGVVKVGGSLFSHPSLAKGLGDYLLSLKSRYRTTVIVAGGGTFADQVAELQIVHGLSDAICHNLAIQAMELSSDLLCDILGENLNCMCSRKNLSFARAATSQTQSLSRRVDYLFLRATEFLGDFEFYYAPLPHNWEVTSDSIAAAAAAHLNADLILLKSVSVPQGTSWQTASQKGWVDSYFPTLVEEFNLQVTAINFRDTLP